MTAPDFSFFKETQQNAWKLIFQRLDKLKSENKSLKVRVEQLEKRLSE